MKQFKFLKYWPFVVALFGWLFLDLFTKYLAVTFLISKIVFIPHFFYLTLHFNSGIAFGIELGRWFQVALSVLVLMGLLFVLIEEKNLLSSRSFPKQVLLGIIVGGAFGNLANRVVSGFVIDFIYLNPFPVFNVADIGITLGLIAFIIFNLISSKTKTN